MLLVFFLLWLRLACVQALLVVSITNNSNGLHDVTTATPCPLPTNLSLNEINSQHCWPCDHTHTVTWSRSLIYWILHQENRNEREKPAITLLQVKTNLTSSAEWQKLYSLTEKSWEKLAQKTQLATAKKSRNATKKTTLLCGKTAQLATLVTSVMKNVLSNKKVV